jgi:hypothetical protein
VDLPVDRRKLRGIFAPVLPRALIPVNQTHTVTALTDNLYPVLDGEDAGADQAARAASSRSAADRTEPSLGNRTLLV